MAISASSRSSVATLSPEEQTRIREKSMLVCDKHKDEIGVYAVDAIVAELAKIRKEPP